MNKNIFFVGLLLACLFGCGESSYFKETKKIPATGWAFSDSLTFKVPISDSSKRFDLLLDLSHSDEYLFQNIYLYINTTLPSGKRLGKRLNVDLADKMGVWKGNCSGSNCDVEVNLQSNAYFNLLGDYQFTLKQFMRTDTLTGVNRVGLRLREVQD